MASALPVTRPCNVLLVYPRFAAASFWNFRKTCEVVGARYPAIPLGLLTVAALLPQDWTIRLVDCNTGTLTDSDIDHADLVMTGGMLPQQPDTLSIIKRCKARGRPVVVGGPDATSSPQHYGEADFLVLGEAEPVMADFVAAWNSGARHGIFEAQKFTTDVTTSPVPRFDLLNFKHYLYVGVQYSRGCPFNCEFCDIIELFGRVPRAKTTEQMLGELDRLYALGYRGQVDFVDDNLIGNKKALKLFLPHLIEWQEKHGFPFEFSTEASVNLADDDVLLGMLRDAGFYLIFVGIESPDTETLVAMQKKQNTRRSLTDSIHKIYGAGISVTAGFILGFDTERKGAAEGMIACIEDASIPVCMVGLLYALPNTQLTRRLEQEGRLHAGNDVAVEDDYGDQCTSGLNFETLRPRRDILVDYLSVLERIYTPRAYFGRLRVVGRKLRRKGSVLPPSLPAALADVWRVTRIIWFMTAMRPRWAMHVWWTLADCAIRNPTAIRSVISIMALYLHLGPFSRDVMQSIRDQIARIDRGEEEKPALVAVPSAPLPAAIHKPAKKVAAGHAVH
ncbi:B12-binding domain-containing radical SAM protein [Rhabdaerophilum sp. SD176]|uniref:B12-binding domain-containing radical SAM protein n=1 Tax=Rhabdaerophilum sp. SD176 TaxID=2983548 RepID=UPI0024E022A6|nr:B12-binding domain-containing radical SAM protein [Rhabdaerophilum sp. SD176]